MREKLGNMKILILSVSKKETLYSDAQDEYVKRLTRYADINLDTIVHSDKNTETQKLLTKIKPSDYVVLLDERGSVIKSEEFAEMIENRQNDSIGRIVFIIGGAYGVGEEIVRRANYTLSFGSMVWPHALCHTMLLEQIYRAYTILNGVPYHNA